MTKSFLALRHLLSVDVLYIFLGSIPLSPCFHFYYVTALPFQVHVCKIVPVQTNEKSAGYARDYFRS